MKSTLEFNTRKLLTHVTGLCRAVGIYVQLFSVVCINFPPPYDCFCSSMTQRSLALFFFPRFGLSRWLLLARLICGPAVASCRVYVIRYSLSFFRFSISRAKASYHWYNNLLANLARAFATQDRETSLVFRAITDEDESLTGKARRSLYLSLDLSGIRSCAARSRVVSNQSMEDRSKGTRPRPRGKSTLTVIIPDNCA